MSNKITDEKRALVIRLYQQRRYTIRQISSHAGVSAPSVYNILEANTQVPRRRSKMGRQFGVSV